LITLEFRRDPRDQRLILIKADPRVVRPTSLSTALGMDTPTALYRLAVGDKVDVPASYPEGIAWLWETTLLETFWNNRDVRPVREELLAIGRHRDRIKAYAYFDLRDPLPFIMHSQWRTRAWLRARIRGLMLRCARALGRDAARPAPSALGG
jgi:predicted ATP-grasp superfamily ATP-dependent carboligase